MRPFELTRAATLDDAVAVHGGGAVFLGGGTTLLDLMKLDVLRPDRLIALPPGGEIEDHGDRLSVPAGTTMAALAAHPRVADLPVLRDALLQAASPQIREMATVAGNLLQRTRCPHFRSTDPCGKRDPGTGCAAIGGDEAGLAILGTSDRCIASYPGDMAVALVALDATLVWRTTEATGTMPVADLHRAPGDAPHVETTLPEGALVTALEIPLGRWNRTIYHKVRERSSYAFAQASAAVALSLDADGTVRDVRIALGGVATKPWRCLEAEAVLRGHRLEAPVVAAAAQAAVPDMDIFAARRWKIAPARGTLRRAIASVA